MKDVKQKPRNNAPKVMDKARDIGHSMKKVYSRAKSKADIDSDQYDSTAEYAEAELSEIANDGVEATRKTIRKAGRKIKEKAEKKLEKQLDKRREKLERKQEETLEREMESDSEGPQTDSCGWDSRNRHSKGKDRSEKERSTQRKERHGQSKGQKNRSQPKTREASHSKKPAESRHAYSESKPHGKPAHTTAKPKTAPKNTAATVRKAPARTVKGALNTVKTVEKSAKVTTKAAAKTAKENAKAAEKTAQAAKVAAERAAQAAKAAVKIAQVVAKAIVAAAKAIAAAVKELAAAIAAGGWVAVAVIVVICLIALICGSVFGIFFSGEDSGTGMSMQTAVQEINADYDAKMEAEKNSVAYDNMEISGGRAVWKDVLAVYAVKTNTDKNNPQEVATMDESKKQILSDIFWEMNSISSRRESHSETEITETDDGNGNIVQTETTVTKTTLYITVSHLTVDEMADLYGFDAEQREYLAELLKDKNNSLWAAVLYGIRYSEDQIVTVALSQVGNVGGEPYWSWYGFGSRVEWCACFVSWCADQCGYIDTGVVPKYAGCVNGVQWFKDRGQWIDGSAEPVPGMIIFFDWDNKGSSGPQDGQSDHTGIVQKVENGIVHTVEGNSGDSCRVNQYSVGHYEILGYGVPNY